MKYSYQLSEWMSKDKLRSITDRLSEESYAIYDIEAYSKETGQQILDEYRKGDYAVFTTGERVSTLEAIREHEGVIKELREDL